MTVAHSSKNLELTNKEPVVLSHNDILVMLSCLYSIPRHIGKSDAEILNEQYNDITADLFDVNHNNEVITTVSPLQMMRRALQRATRRSENNNPTSFVHNMEVLSMIQPSQRTFRKLTNEDRATVRDVYTAIADKGAVYSENTTDLFLPLQGYRDSEIEAGKNFMAMAGEILQRHQRDMKVILPASNAFDGFEDGVRNMVNAYEKRHQPKLT